MASDDASRSIPPDSLPSLPSLPSPASPAKTAADRSTGADAAGPDAPDAPLGDMEPAAFRAHGHRLVDWIADYLEHAGDYPVLSRVKPGEIAAALPAAAPEAGESFDGILRDFERVLVPGLTHWNHPGFFAYFAISASGPGILADFLSSALNQQAMLWRTSPAATELEGVTLRWLRDLMGLPSAFDGVIYDTASISTLHALAAAREMKVPRVRTQGLSGRDDLPRVRIYGSEHTHSCTDKAAITLGLGHDAVCHIPADDRFALRVDLLEAAIARDLADGLLPIAVVATVGSTSTAAIDPVPAIADLCARHDLWLHVDAAYGGVAAIVPDRRYVLDGCDRAHSLTVNPHKWLFVPFDLSVLYCRRMDLLRAAFSLIPEFLKTPEDGTVTNLMDTGVPLGRRFRALKLWMVLRYFGADGIRRRLAEHMRLARLFASWVDADPNFERLASVEFSLVCFRARPSSGIGTTRNAAMHEAAHDGAREAATPGSAAQGSAAQGSATQGGATQGGATQGGATQSTAEDGLAADALNERLMDRVNASGDVFLSHTRLHGRIALRFAIGNLRTTEAHIARAWTLLKLHAAALDGRGVSAEVQ